MLPEIKSHLDGVPEPTILIYIKRAVKQFCTDSQIWRKRTAEGTVEEADVPEDGDWTITLPGNTEYTITVAGDHPYIIYAVNDVLINKKSARSAEGRVNPFAYDEDTGLFSMHREAFADAFPAKVVIEVLLQPTKAATTVPDFMIDLYSEGIASYAISELMMMPQREWSDASMSRHYLGKYQRRVAEARIIKAKQGTTGPLEIDPIPVETWF